MRFLCVTHGQAIVTSLVLPEKVTQHRVGGKVLLVPAMQLTQTNISLCVRTFSVDVKAQPALHRLIQTTGSRMGFVFLLSPFATWCARKHLLQMRSA
jgi:hypothetical protein